MLSCVGIDRQAPVHGHGAITAIIPAVRPGRLPNHQLAYRHGTTVSLPRISVPPGQAKGCIGQACGEAFTVTHSRTDTRRYVSDAEGHYHGIPHHQHSPFPARRGAEIIIIGQLLSRDVGNRTGQCAFRIICLLSTCYHDRILSAGLHHGKTSKGIKG